MLNSIQNSIKFTENNTKNTSFVQIKKKKSKKLKSGDYKNSPFGLPIFLILRHYLNVFSINFLI